MKKKVLIIVLMLLIITITILIYITAMLFNRQQKNIEIEVENKKIEQQKNIQEINEMDLTISKMTQELLDNIEDKKQFVNSIKEFLYKNSLNGVNSIELFQHNIKNDKIYMYYKGNSTNKKQSEDNVNNSINLNTVNRNNNSEITIYLEVEYDKNTKETTVNFAGD